MGAATSINILGSDTVFREGLATLLQTKGFDVVTAGDIETLTGAAKLGEPNLLLSDVPDADDISNFIGRLRAVAPRSRIVMLADEPSFIEMNRAFSAGIDGFLTKNISTESLVENLKLILSGEKIFPSPLGSMWKKKSNRATGFPAIRQPEVSCREMEILRWLIKGASNKHIANLLDITESTVKLHLKNFQRKMKMANRTQLAIWALRSGIFNDLNEGL